MTAQRKNLLQIAGIVVVLALLALGLFFLMRPKAVTGATPAYVSANKTIQLAQTSTTIAAPAPAGLIVQDTGTPQWIQIKSKGSGRLFQDLSDNYYGLTIYRIHNPRILKTATTLYPDEKYLYDMENQYPNALIMNASGWNMLTGQLAGFQINNGKLFQDWDITNHATAAFVVYKNGTTGVVSDSTSAQSLITNGAAQTYSFGSILVKNGKILPDDGTVNWEIHSFIGADKNNNIITIISDTSSWNRSVLEQVTHDLHLESLVVLDGGGSSQLAVRGNTIVPSQDDRPIADFVVMK
ncbi:MAG: phosphodiester glycosidase family protein [Streptococcaceae bacterium]|jgi:exopolysaccharide biosynthesis protein|nr:phosphodiester glycosidase family protein [Streptococcaceae bacterium]